MHKYLNTNKIVILEKACNDVTCVTKNEKFSLHNLKLVWYLIKTGVNI